MTLADFFNTVNTASIRMVHAAGQLQLRGPAGSVTEAIRTAAAEHKAALLALLPDESNPDVQEALAIQSEPRLSEAGAVGDAGDGPWDQAVARVESEGVPPWDQAEADRLVAEALAQWQAPARPAGRLADAIDAAYLAEDLPVLRKAVAAFLDAVPSVEEAPSTAAPDWPPWIDIEDNRRCCPGCDFCRPTKPGEKR